MKKLKVVKVVILMLCAVFLMSEYQAVYAAEYTLNWAQTNSNAELVKSGEHHENILYEDDGLFYANATSSYVDGFPLASGKYAVTVLGYYSGGSEHSTYLYHYSPLKTYTEDLNCVLDISAAGGTPIYSVASGTVYTNAYASGSGNYIVIKHDDGSYSYYGHMQQLSSYKAGSKVAAGTEIGKVGMTGTATGNHLHFEWSGHDPYCTYSALGYVYTYANSGAAIYPHKHNIFKVNKATVSNVTQTTAKVRADVTATCSQLSKVGLQWGKTTSLTEKALSWSVGSSLTFVEVAFDGSEGPKLSPGTTYYYRFFAQKKDGTYIYDQTRNFTTPCQHTYNSGTITKNPTCTATGVKTYTCTKCSAKKTETVAAKGHTAVTDAAVAATCTSTGKTAGSHCSVCNTVIKAQTVVAKKEHTYNSGQITVAATCSKKGVKTFTCTKCGATKTEAIATTQHIAVVDPAIAATCTSTGKTAGSHCSVCNAVIKAQTVVAKKEHTYNSGQITVAATCSNKGVKTFTCTQCGATKTEAIATTQHIAVVDPAIAATCTSKGKTEGSHCEICSAVLKKQTDIPKLEHNYVDISVKKAVVGRNGSAVRECKVCGHEITSVIYCPSEIVLSKEEYVYNGKVRKPTVKVMDTNGKEIDKKNYSVDYSENRSVGEAKVKVTFKGNYSGKMQAAYTINPKGTSITKLTATAKGFELKWKKQNTQISGYQIEYSTSSKFTKGTTKSITVKSAAITDKKVSKLISGKKYYVRVRCYKTAKVNGVTSKVYSAWSTAKSVKTK